MKISTLELVNFKKFTETTIALHPQFTLLVGENGAGKTSILDALAVALNVWLEDPPDSLLADSKRSLSPSDKRLVTIHRGDRTQLQEAPGAVSISVLGQLLSQNDMPWGVEIPQGKKKVFQKPPPGLFSPALLSINEAYTRAARGEELLLPVIAYYGAGRAWISHDQLGSAKAVSNGPLNRWSAFYHCLNERIRVSDLAEWFQSEAIARGNRGGRYRPGFEVVRRAVLECIPGGEDIWYDADRKEIGLTIDGNPQPFTNLSSGQRTMLALVADIAVKMVTQNNHLVPAEELTAEDKPIPRVLAQTPGVVLIDEIDVHLHPKWQRRIVADLKRTFPSIQFVATTHSPQVIGEVQPEEIRLLRKDSIEIPAQSFGMDTNWILLILMDADEQQVEIKHKLLEVSKLIAEKKLPEAQELIVELRKRTGNSEAIQRAASTIDRIRILGR